MREKEDKKVELVEVRCPKCRESQIIDIQREEIPKCERCKTRMILHEILTEGKSY